MTYIINSYSGTPIASIPDKTVNTTATSIRLPGRNYPNYGELMDENLVWMLENFAGAPLSGPTNPRIGQIWYNVAEARLKVYDGTNWVNAAVPNTTPVTPPPAPPGPPPPGPPVPPGPVDPVDGELLYDQTKKQLFVRGSNQWNLVGPVGAADGNDANSPSIPGYTSVDALYVTDTASSTHKVLRWTVGGQLVAVVSNDATFTPAAAPTNPLQGFTNIAPGINLNPTIPNISLVGKASSAAVAENADFLGGISATSFMRRDQTNLPTNTNLYNLGSTSNKYNTVYATTFDGLATSAVDAQTLNGTAPGIFLRKDATNVPTADATHDLGSISSSWFATFSTKFVAGASSVTQPLFIFKDSLSTGMGSPAPNMVGFYINGTETVRLVNRSLRLGDVTQDAGTGSDPSIQPAYLSVIMNQANTDGLTLRSVIPGPGLVQPNTMINMWGSYGTGGFTQKGISFRISTLSVLNAFEIGSITFADTGVYYNTVSDYRRKTNVEPLSQAIGLVKKVQAKTYNWVDKNNTEKVFGFLAHELQAVVPDAVQGTKDEIDEKGNPVYQSVDNSKLVPVLWAAVQELSAKLAALEAKLA